MQSSNQNLWKKIHKKVSSGRKSFRRTFNRFYHPFKPNKDYWIHPMKEVRRFIRHILKQEKFDDEKE